MKSRTCLFHDEMHKCCNNGYNDVDSIYYEREFYERDGSICGDEKTFLMISFLNVAV